MFEKVNLAHPDKVADRIGGAIVDIAYTKERNPRIAVEVLIGHDTCTVIVETSVLILKNEVEGVIKRIAGEIKDGTNIIIVPQDEYLSENQDDEIRCGDNGIFKGLPITVEESILTTIAQSLYKEFPYDGKYVYSLKDDKLIICQSNATTEQVKRVLARFAPISNVVINPLGEWTGGFNVDTGCTNRKLGSDMGFAVTGGGINCKDLSKADVTLNIYAHLKAQETNQEVNIYCAIGDDMVDGKPYSEIVEIAREYIYSIGGFEKFAEWGLIR